MDFLSKLSMRTRIFAMFLPIVIVIGIVAVVWTRDRVVSTEQDLTAKIVESAANELGGWVENYLTLLNSLTTTPVIQSAELDAIGEFLAVYAKSLKAGEIESFLFADAKGNAIYHNGIKGNVADRFYYKDLVANQSKQCLVSDPFLARSTGNVVVAIACVVKDRSNEIKGLVFASFNTAALTKIANEREISSASKSWLVDSAGVLFAHPNKDFILKMTLKNASSEYNYKDLSPQTDDILSGRKTIARYTNAEGADRTIFFAKIRNTQGWLYAISMPTEHFYEVSNRLAQMLAVGFLTILVALWFSITVLTKSLTKRIGKGVLELSHANKELHAACEQIAASSISLAEGASTQASSVEQVSATIEESTAVNTQNSENAREASVLAQGANDAASKGNEKIKRLMTSMVEITDASEQIAKIIKAIDEIAFQTNLLALNAAVEAARAGEQGLGFAVVADEVKSLAGRSANAAKETSGIIEKAIAKIKEGNQVAKDTNESFAEILDKSKKTSDLIGEIAASVKEQAEGMNQIATAMGQIDSITQQNAATSEEAAAASEQMSAQANAMMESTAELGKIVGLTID
ncbi:hypothetical protein FACS189487_08710 [Campylobacterota bacterium]|nr:hypothetical protein FACS189487_08710 [Campylobacterota bacterium]